MTVLHPSAPIKARPLPHLDTWIHAHRPTLATVGVVSILVHALDAWVIRVDGATDLSTRTIWLVAVGAGAVLARTAATLLTERARAAALLTAGLTSTVIVGPILASHIDKQGLGGSRYTGLLALAGAIWLIGSGTKRLVHGARTRLRRWLALPLAFLIAQFFVLPAGLAVLATHAARPPLKGRTPSDVGLRYENVRFSAADGVQLRGWYVASANGAAVLLRHGSGSTRVNLLDHAALLAAAGYGVLLTDARGHGASGGRINELGWHGAGDISAALDYLQARDDVKLGIGVLGLSMGGEEALNTAAVDDRISAVVAEGVGTSTYNDSVSRRPHAMARVVNWIQFALVDLLSDASQPDGVIESMPLIAPRPVLLIAGRDEKEQAYGSVYADAGDRSTALWSLADAPHIEGLSTNGAAYRRRVLRAFDRALLSTGPRPRGG